MSTACIITGASKGFGRAVATELAKGFGSLHFVLVARDTQQLEETRRQVQAVQPAGNTTIREKQKKKRERERETSRCV